MNENARNLDAYNERHEDDREYNDPEDCRYCGELLEDCICPLLVEQEPEPDYSELPF